MHTRKHPTHIVVTIGLEGDYSVTEGGVQEVCAVLVSGTLERDAIVTLNTADGSATGTFIISGFPCKI